MSETLKRKSNGRNVKFSSVRNEFLQHPDRFELSVGRVFTPQKINGRYFHNRVGRNSIQTLVNNGSINPNILNTFRYSGDKEYYYNPQTRRLNEETGRYVLRNQVANFFLSDRPTRYGDVFFPNNSGLDKFIRDFTNQFGANARIRFISRNPKSPSQIWGLKNTTISNLKTALIEAWEKLNETDYEGQVKEEVSLREFLASNFQIFLANQVLAGCGYSDKEFIEKGNFRLKNIQSRRNNCLFDCIYNTTKKAEHKKYSNMRKKYGLKAGEKIDIQNAYKIILGEKLNIKILDIDGFIYNHDGVITEENGIEDITNTKFIFDEGHCYIFHSKLEHSLEERLKLKMKEYYKIHKDEINQNRRERYEENKEEINQKKREKYQENKEEIRQKRKENYKELDFDVMTIDLETRSDNNLETATYSIGKDKELTYYYKQVPTLLCVKTSNISKTFFGTDCVVQFLDFIGEEHRNRKRYYIYAHNGGRFDYFFILNEIVNNPKFKVNYKVNNISIRGSTILGMDYLGNFFRDTYNFMPSSLSKLCDDFRIKEKKKDKYIFEDGKEMTSMDICLYEEDKLNPDEYISYLNDKNPKMKEFYIDYCLYDCISLLEIVNTFYEKVKEIIDKVASNPDLDEDKIKRLKSINLRRKMTLPSIGYSIFLATQDMREYIDKNNRRVKTEDIFIPNKEERPWINQFKIGGISEVYKAGKYVNCEIACCDVVSLYPTAMLKEQYPKGKPVYTLTYREGFLGLYKVQDIVFPKELKGMIKNIPDKTENGLNWKADEIKEAFITSIDIEYLKKLKATFKVVDGKYWKESYNPFVNSLKPIADGKILQDKYKLSKDEKYNPSLREVYKMLLNSNFGKCLENISFYRYEEFDDLSMMDDKYEESNEVKARYYSNGKLVFKLKSDKMSKSPIQLGVFILAYSRKIIHNYFDMIGRENIIATETDSIYFKKSLLPILQNSNDDNYKVGKAFGNMEIENGKIEKGIDDTIKNAYFLGKKCYGLIGVNGKNKFRFKGVPTKKLTEEKYEELYKNEKVDFEDILVFKRELFSGMETGIRKGEITKNIIKSKDLEYNLYENII